MTHMIPRRLGGRSEVLAVGHVTQDRICHSAGRPAEEWHEQPGGSAFYAAAVLASLGIGTTVLTKLAARDRARLLSPLEALGVEIAPRPAAATTCFENRYLDGIRQQRVLRLAPPFLAGDFHGLSASAIQLGPLIKDDIAPAAVTEARKRCRLLAIDVQGLLRRLSGGRVRPFAGVERSALAQADILKADREEARLLTSLGDPRGAARRLAQLCRGEALVTLGAQGVLLAEGDRLHEIPAVDAGPVVDTTGCGDSLLAAYLARRLRGDAPLAAARFATVVAAMKATRYGPFQMVEGTGATALETVNRMMREGPDGATLNHRN